MRDEGDPWELGRDACHEFSTSLQCRPSGIWIKCAWYCKKKKKEK